MVSVVRSMADTLADAANPQRWLEGLSSSLSGEEQAMITRAFDEARALYCGKTMAQTGEDLFNHAVAAAAIVADLNLLPDAIVATLMFAASDYREDWQAWLSETFNPTVAVLVEGVNGVRRITELARIDKLSTPEERARQAETMRKMLLAMVADIRVVLIKLAWRTQTMHYLAEVADETVRRRIATETLDLFAPLANRLGVWQIKWELEDLGFRHTEPDSYKRIAKLLDERRLERIDYIDRLLDTLRTELKNAGVKAEVAGRPKHIFSIWKKMKKKKLDFCELYDIRAVRILVERLPDCYTALGIIHGTWQPIPGEFDDYISHPKANNYRSLHTAVIGPEDKAVEVQIRTFEMHEHAEFGVAAHWRYKEGGKGDAAYEEKISWLRQLLDWREEMSDREGLAEAFKTELFADTIYVLTPQGRVIALPFGATPIDFAYSVHTNLGHRCRGAKVEGQIVPLSTPLQNGQRVEILTAKEGGPSVNWLHDGWVKSHRAISKIRQHIRLLNADTVRETGKMLFERELARHSHMQPNLGALAEKLGYDKLEEVYGALGHGELTTRVVSNAIVSFAPPPPTDVAPESLVKASKGGHDAGGVLIEGVDNLMTVLAKCCKPAPPDGVMGFVTKGRGISIHRTNCLTLKKLSVEAPERLIAAEWGDQRSSVFPIDIEIIAMDRPGLLRDLSDVLSREKLNLIGVNTLSRDTRARMRFTVEVRQVQDISRVLSRMMELSGVQEARRL
ncbi:MULTISPECIES: RelA/SpoT family protein [Chromobacterium]|uniref:GTP pyrophosphokinase n=1 Tax=Chromobacterium rhizoryzae TaxID=1778675 RepID=A0AAD0W7I7_9NEIS|nr:MULTISPECIES: bifunctional (p)ppGpp synthetase/guanosine-3',5'-bis(diphosphate) 3'-pyrophosphohydrolase [Chromobacterium]AXT45311.1 bifunctional (p)ppGpp synthetase/guanosine-3',5'-bis(diphosphate) 3'-pyrophosphohydrolase [Chromobacterium rhizoryzae]MDH0341565.1 bifunctional (p)ppGpp synthetase/guanosine-3',5'-bis(diphosphate) 3'-pyrophosphohydrolase [Chromobacterium haemolyticum]OQS37788.1 GTP pyrophosphokinase [Chromobacterium haemolyticum]PTU71566.1 bifunctional (p)ppGpp synthetase/guanos